VGPPPVSALKSSTPKKTPEPKSVFWEPEELVGVFSEEDDGGCDFDDYKSRNIQNNKNVNLPHLVTRWKDGELRDRCTVFLWMLSGLDPNDIRAKVCDGGMKMTISFNWPHFMQDARRLTEAKKWNLSKDSSKVVEVDSAIKMMRTSGTEESSISCTLEIHLGMQVEEQFYHEDSNGRIIHGNKIMREALKMNKRMPSSAERIPTIMCKYELMGIRDNYKNNMTAHEFSDEEVSWIGEENAFYYEDAKSKRSTKTKAQRAKGKGKKSQVPSVIQQPQSRLREDHFSIRSTRSRSRHNSNYVEDDNDDDLSSGDSQEDETQDNLINFEDNNVLDV
jgi:hypothetical protein